MILVSYVDVTDLDLEILDHVGCHLLSKRVGFLIFLFVWNIQ